MQLYLQSNNVQVKMRVPGNSRLQSEKLWMVISARTAILFTAPLNFKNRDSLDMTFPLKDLPSGICYATVLNERGETLSERLFTNHEMPAVKMGISKSGDKFNTRSPIQLEISLRDEQDKPLAGDFTITVVNKKFHSTLLPVVPITSYLLIQSDLIDHSIPEGLTGPSLDLFLITQKNNRMNWKDLLSKND
jgi:hypothetical protein